MEDTREEKKSDSKEPIDIVFEHEPIRQGVPKWKQVIKDIDPEREKLSVKSGRKRVKTPSKKICDRCSKLYMTFSKRSRICDDCKFPTGKGGKKSNEVKWDKKKQEWMPS